MKKSVLSLAVLATLAIGGAAHAQSNVQVYGLIDAGIEHVNHANAAGSGATKVISGGKNTSRWGFRGTEDLGSGLKAVFGLEGGILLDTGASDGALFKRQAFVGLEGSFGRVIIGKSFSTTYDFIIGFDPLGYAPNYSWATSGSATGASKYGMNTAYDNMVKYSGQAGEFKYGASVGLGEQAGNASDNRKYSAAASWAHAGLGLVATIEQTNAVPLPGFAHDETKVYHAGVDYKVGDLRFTAAGRSFKMVFGKPAADLRADTYWGGVTYVMKAITLTGAVYHVNIKNVADGQDADPTMYVARSLYALSKRTDLYAAAAYVKGKNGKLVGLSRDDAAFGTSQTGVTAGIQHRF